jgi:hypothetical protein
VTLPTFFISVAKAGNPSLRHYLDRHPEIRMPANAGV